MSTTLPPFPALYYNVNWPPVWIQSDPHSAQFEQAWQPVNLSLVMPGAPAWPKLYANVNVPPVWILNDDHQAMLYDPSWRKQNLTPGLPARPPVQLTPTLGNHPADGGDYSFQVTVLGPGASGMWIVEQDPIGWMVVTGPPGPQTISGPVTYTLLENTGPLRTARIYVNASVYNVVQQQVAEGGRK